MKVFAIGDHHLSFQRPVNPEDWTTGQELKPMSIFGDNWTDHYIKIYRNWREKVSTDDLVLIPGDISWANTLAEMEYDLAFINLLPGKKVLIKGNHDYWWQSISQLRSRLPDSFYLIQNDSIKFKELLIGGTRGWNIPVGNYATAQDRKIFQREVIRLELSLKDMVNSGDLTPEKIVLFHYMPVDESHQKNEMIELLQYYGVQTCLYGHLHGAKSHLVSLTGEKWGINFYLVSSDYINFKPKFILQV